MVIISLSIFAFIYWRTHITRDDFFALFEKKFTLQPQVASMVIKIDNTAVTDEG